MDIGNDNETWKRIEILDGKYTVSNLGNIRNQSSGRILKTCRNSKSGFLYVQFHGCQNKKIYIHKAVAEAFVPNTEGFLYVRHINGDKSDNRASNLEWHTKRSPKREYITRKPKWTDESCTEAAKLCSSATEFGERFPGGYRYAHKTNLWKSFTWFNHNTDPNSRTYAVYAYEDSANNAVYVGLTNNLARRDREHRKKNYKNDLREYDIVRQHFEDVGLPTPKPIVLRDGMDGFEAQGAEDEFKSRYASDGWSLINIGRTGAGVSSLGNLAYARPGREECADIAGGCRSRAELKRKSWIAYTTIVMNGWEDLLPPKARKRDDSDWVRVLSEYRDRGDLMLRNRGLYKNLREKCLLDKYMPSEYDGMDDNGVIEASAVYGDRRSLYSENYELYWICRRRGLLGSLPAKRKIRLATECDASFGECAEVASGYEYRYQLRKARPDIFKRMKSMGWLDQIMPCAASSGWTESSALEFSSAFVNRTELRESSNSCYKFLHKRGLLDRAFPSKVRRLRPVFDATLSDCLEHAELCSCWTQYKRRHAKYANLCIRNGWAGEVKSVFAEKRRVAALKLDGVMEKCRDCARLCLTKREFRERHPKEYSLASKHKWLKEYTWLKGCKGEKNDEKMRLAEKTSRLYTRKKDFREKSPYEYNLAVRFRMLKSFDWLE